jgi:D-arabinose 1-dehydrogenase-like Zn-dependent alcohol dehydrogenase
VAGKGERVGRFALGDRVGVPWLGWTCGVCLYCRSGRENLCDRALFTGYQLDGGYAEYTVADQRFCFPLPPRYSDTEAAPLLCAGLIGYRSLVMAGDARRLGIYGFGAAAHIVAQVARHQGRQVFAFTREGDSKAQERAMLTTARERLLRGGPIEEVKGALDGPDPVLSSPDASWGKWCSRGSAKIAIAGGFNRSVLSIEDGRGEDKPDDLCILPALFRRPGQRTLYHLPVLPKAR